MNDFTFSVIFLLTGFVVGIVFTAGMVGNHYYKLKVEAVESGSAYWCIVDHEKVFSWEDCK